MVRATALSDGSIQEQERTAFGNPVFAEIAETVILEIVPGFVESFMQDGNAWVAYANAAVSPGGGLFPRAEVAFADIHAADERSFIVKEKDLPMVSMIEQSEASNYTTKVQVFPEFPVPSLPDQWMEKTDFKVLFSPRVRV